MREKKDDPIKVKLDIVVWIPRQVWDAERKKGYRRSDIKNHIADLGVEHLIYSHEETEKFDGSK